MTTIAQWRFQDPDDTFRPQDETGNVGDLDVEAGLNMPDITDGVFGQARIFVSSASLGFRAQDNVPGTTLLQRDMTIQVVLSWDIAAQNASGFPGTIYCRGKGTGPAEYANACIELRVVSLAANVGEIRWFWHDLAGAPHTQIGGHFTLPDAGSFTMLTVTRRWVSTTQVVLRHYIGDQLISEIITADGNIGGGTMGTTSIGARWTGAAWGNFLNGSIDEMRIVDYEMSNEELAATWKRVTDTQPKGYRLLRELHPRGFPISDDPSSNVQRETNLWGQGLGFAAAQADNIHDNVMPDRSYGPILARWENICGVPPKPGDSIDTRRARVISHIRNKAGVSIPGLSESLKELIATDPSNLQFLGFKNEMGDAVGNLYNAPEVWQPFATVGAWSFPSAGSQAEINGAANPSIPFDAGMAWTRLEASAASQALYGEGQAMHLLSKLSAASLPANSEAGIYVGDWPHGDYFFFGLRNNGGTFQIVTEVFTAWVSGGVTVQGTQANVPTWLHLFHQGLPAGTLYGNGITPWQWTAAWSTTSEIAGYSSAVNIPMSSGVQRCGLYLRTFGAVVGTPDITFDETRIITPFGDRTFYFYVYRDPAIAGSPDTVGADAVINAIKQAHTKGALVTFTKTFPDDTTKGLVGVTPLGAF